MFLGMGLIRLSELVVPPARVLAETPTEPYAIPNAQDMFRLAAKKVTPSVVNITVLKRTENSGNELSLEDLSLAFHVQAKPALQPQGVGSGVIVDAENGYILTNGHVVAAGTNWVVRLGDKREFEATLVGVDLQSDVAVIKIKANHLSEAKLGDSDTLEVGDWVLAIGNPFGLLENSVTAGIVSAKSRHGLGSQYEDYLQTDAAINMGNSGGPLVNLQGLVVGLNTAIMSSSGGYQGIGFAIPINRVKAISHKLIHDGVVVRGWMDVRTRDVANVDSQGVSVEGVHTSGPGQKAGLKSGDMIVKYNGQQIHSSFELHDYVTATKPGSKVPLVINRDGATQTMQVIIGTQPDESTQIAGAL
jgi:serine protease Do